MGLGALTTSKLENYRVVLSHGVPAFYRFGRAKCAIVLCALVIRLHDLRHTNASLALAAGVDLKVVSERLGHSQIANTADLYTHVNRGLGKAAAEQIARALRPASPAVPGAFLPQSPEKASQEGGDTVAQPERARPPSHLRRSGA